MKTSDVKFKIDLKKLETGKPVSIGKELYAKKLADSIEIYETKPLEITPEDKESLSKALKTYDKVYKMVCDEIPPIWRFVDSLKVKYCENCHKDIDILGSWECNDLYKKDKATCELSFLRHHLWSWHAEDFPFPDETYEWMKEEFRKRLRLRASKREETEVDSEKKGNVNG